MSSRENSGTSIIGTKNAHDMVLPGLGGGRGEQQILS